MSEVVDRLSQWDSELANLSIVETNSIVELSLLASERPLPTHLMDEYYNKEILDVLTKNSPIPTVHLVEHAFKHGNKSGMYDSQQFLNFCSEVENARTLQTQAPFLKLQSEMQHAHSFCGDVISQISNVRQNLNSILENYEQVKKRTDSLHNSCTSLMNETTDLLNCAENISRRLDYFDELEDINKQLNSPVFSVANVSFVPMLARIDECIRFFLQHQDYKEATVYLAKFNLALSKALSMIRTYVVSVFKAACESVSQGPKVSNLDSHPSIFYGKFKAYGSKVKIILEELEQRALKSQEFGTLLYDCHLSYYQQRVILIMPMISEYLTALEKQCSRDISSFVRSGCLYVCQFCLDEFQLYIHFFSTGGHAISQIINSLCSYFYEFVRPICIKLMHLETLTSLCDILSNEILENKVKLHEGVLGEFADMIKQLLQDIQQRFIYRAQKYIHSDISGYKPVGGDLAYPEKLVLARKIGIGLERGMSESTTPLSDVVSVSSIGSSKSQSTASPADQHAMWYPTVRRTLLCLSKLHQCVDKVVFETISQEAIAECIKSLQTASKLIELKKGNLDSSLFLIKHLLILREQLVPFEVEFTVKETVLDFTRTKEKAKELLSYKKRTKIFNFNRTNALLEFLIEGAPELKEKTLNSKKDVDLVLKSSCEDLILYLTNILSHPLHVLLDKFRNFKRLIERSETASEISIAKQPFADPQALHKEMENTLNLMKTKVPQIFESMHTYLIYTETVQILFRPVRLNIHNQFQELHSFITQHYQETDKLIIACPSAEEISFALMYTFPASPNQSNSS